mmetsp:Transcript_46550/g.56343  ORF Transcript_46550/g.56343 Transcript_46550/m.56343 type:complete len:804 (-) Transcript_46550:259-2670(-)
MEKCASERFRDRRESLTLTSFQSLPPPDELQDQENAKFGRPSLLRATPKRALYRRLSRRAIDFASLREADIYKSVEFNEEDLPNTVETDSTPILLLRFTSKATPELIKQVKKRLESTGELKIAAEEISSRNGTVVLGITTTQDELLLEAEQVNLVKMTNPAETYGKARIMEPFRKDNPFRYLNVDSPSFFTGAERVTLCWSMLDGITVLNHDELENEMSLLFDELGVEYLRQNQYSIPDKLMESFRSMIEDGSCDPLLHVLKQNEFVDVVSAVHHRQILRTFHSDAMNPLKTFPLDSLRAYYGETVAFYFGWMDFFTKMLIIPGFAGTVNIVYMRVSGKSIVTCEWTTLFGVFMFLWGICFLRMWDRQESKLSYRWGTFDKGDGGMLKPKYEPRVQFQGQVQFSPVTGRLEKHYPMYKRRMKQFVSAWITLCMLSIAFVVMIMSLNLRGYVHPDHNRERWQNDDSHPFYFPSIAALSEKGAIFDATSTYCSLIPTIIHVVVIQTMNTIYRQVAEKLTEWENYETDHGHEDSLILKRFAFEAFDAFLPLFYLAFYEKDILKLRSELVQVFNFDMFRRMALEFIVPRATQIIGKKADDIRKTKKLDITKDDDDYTPLTDESELDEYEEFDDYLEMVIQLGYITLFASAYPFASAVALIANIVEVRTDLLKLTQVCRRPRPYRVGTIGTWKIVLICTVWLSALTNCLIFGMTSNQLMELIPNYLISDSDLDFVTGKGSIAAVVLIFGLERLMLVVGLIIYLALPSVPEDVQCELQRIQFVEMKESLEFRRSNLVEHEKTVMRPNVS